MSVSLVGRLIVEVRPMSREEVEAEGWDDHSTAAMVLLLDDGTILYPSRDEEGNGPGALFGVEANGGAFGLFSGMVQLWL